MSHEERAHNELFEKVGNLMATTQATRESVALLRADMNARLDGILQAVNAQNGGTNLNLKGVSDRVSMLEGDRRMVFGVGGAIAFVFSIFGGWIWDSIKHVLRWA